MWHQRKTSFPHIGSVRHAPLSPSASTPQADARSPARGTVAQAQSEHASVFTFVPVTAAAQRIVVRLFAVPRAASALRADRGLVLAHARVPHGHHGFLRIVWVAATVRDPRCGLVAAAARYGDFALACAVSHGQRGVWIGVRLDVAGAHGWRRGDGDGIRNVAFRT